MGGFMLLEEEEEEEDGRGICYAEDPDIIDKAQQEGIGIDR